jgi:hypothetical protein
LRFSQDFDASRLTALFLGLFNNAVWAAEVRPRAFNEREDNLKQLKGRDLEECSHDFMHNTT